MRAGGAFNLVLSGGVACTDALVLLWVWVAGPSVGDAVTKLMRMLAATALLPWTTTNLDRQSAALL